LCTARWRGWGTGIKKTLHASEQEREDVRQLRQQWLQELPTLEATRLVFIDESAAKTNMIRLRGRARHGARLLALAPHGHGCTTTLIAAIRLNGHTAAMEVSGPADGSVFREYVRKVLVLSLTPGDVVIMDNLQTHYDGEALRLIKACGATVKFLPPYSPDFNPIEKMWSKIKNRLRSLAARTQRALSRAIAQAFQTITAADAQGWFFSCGITAS
jgi:transposase